MKKVIIYSGGLDSTVLLYDQKNQGHDIRALGINYGQRHKKELLSAMAITHELGIPFEVADLQSLREILPGSSQTDEGIEVPEGHYEEENMRATVVPNRNMIMLAVAAGHAISHGCQSVVYGAHSGDHAVYPDCRPEFIRGLAVALKLCHYEPIHLEGPFQRLTKSEIVKLGLELKVPFEKTWSCYKGGEYHCGRCGTCVERREAFHLAGIGDPTIYAQDAPSIDELVKGDWRI